MKNFFISASGVDARGVGPRIILLSLPTVILAVVLKIFAPEMVTIPFFNNPGMTFFGWGWLGTGLVAFVASLAQFIANFPKGKLITSGMFSLSRNPIYSCWIVFILPALAIVLNNWIFLPAALVMYLVTIWLVREEEKELLEVYGKEYETYKKRVGIVFPW